MLYLKQVNEKDIDQQYDFFACMPPNENGFINPYSGISRSVFAHEALPRLIRYSRGLDLPVGYVPETCFFLWEDHRIVGLFKVRHHLNAALRAGAGHIGFGIVSHRRGAGLATRGLAMAVDKASCLIRESEIYMSVYKNNPASLRVQQKNGAYIHHEDETHYYTRIPLAPFTRRYPS